MIAVSPAGMSLAVIIVAGLVIIDVLWELFFRRRRNEQNFYDRESHNDLLREIRRHTRTEEWKDTP